MDDPEGSQGFCLLNNVAIGAAYAWGAHESEVSYSKLPSPTE